MQDVDCFARGSLFGFGVACCWVGGGRHFEDVVFLRFVNVAFGCLEVQLVRRLGWVVVFVLPQAGSIAGGLRSSHDQGLDDSLRLLDVSLRLSLGRSLFHHCLQASIYSESVYFYDEHLSVSGIGNYSQIWHTSHGRLTHRIHRARSAPLSPLWTWSRWRFECAKY